jgi:hypothetical protein
MTRNGSVPHGMKLVLIASMFKIIFGEVLDAFKLVFFPLLSSFLPLPG